MSVERDRRIRQEAAALWRALYGQPPPIEAEGALVLDALMRGLPELGYDRLSSPFLRPGSFSRPPGSS